MAGSGSTALRRGTNGDADIVVSVRDLVVEYPAPRRRVVHAVSGISFDVARGETLGIVGESGCGKTSTGRAVMQLERSSATAIELDGTDLTRLQGRALRRARRPMQMIFQDPVSSLNPSRQVGDLVREGLRTWGTDEADLPDGWVGLGHAVRGPRRRRRRRATPPRVLGRAVPTHLHRPGPRDGPGRPHPPTNPCRRSTSRCRRRS